MVNILGIDIFTGNPVSFTKGIIDDVVSKESQYQNRLVSASSAHGIVFASKTPAFKKTLQQFYYNLPDGLPLVWVGRLKGYKEMSRCTGNDTFHELITSSAEFPVNHFFCGGKEGVAMQLKEAAGKDLNNRQVVGTYSPPFRKLSEEEFARLGEEINRSNADIVWIGLSTPKQEIFAASLAKYTKADYIITVGAVFDFYTGNLKRAPKWIQRFGMEWLYRLLKEPGRLFKRYSEVVPMFIFLNIKEFASQIFSGKKKVI